MARVPYMTLSDLGQGQPLQEEQLDVFDTDIFGMGQLTAGEAKRLRLAGMGQLVREENFDQPDPNDQFLQREKPMPIQQKANPVSGLGQMSTKAKWAIGILVAIPLVSIVAFLFLGRRR